MPSQFDVIDREIPVKGKCYLICRVFDPADFSDALAGLTETAFRRGAAQVYAACRDKAASLPGDGFDAGQWRFTYDGDFYLLYKDLTDPPNGTAPRALSTKPLRAGNAMLFRALYNEAFFSVPNSSTMDEAETEGLLKDDAHICGFFMEGGMPVGVYQLSMGEEPPEIAVVAVSRDFQGRGYGRRALQTLENILLQRGCRRTKLLVSSRNEAAMGLYRAAGYGQAVRHSTWYRTDAK